MYHLVEAIELAMKFPNLGTVELVLLHFPRIQQWDPNVHSAQEGMAAANGEVVYQFLDKFFRAASSSLEKIHKLTLVHVPPLHNKELTGLQ